MPTVLNLPRPLTSSPTTVGLRCPRTLPPDDLMLAAQKNAPDLSEGRIGRTGVLILESDGRLTTHYTFTDFSQHLALLPGPGKVQTVWPSLPERGVPFQSFTDAAGETFTLTDLLAELFAPFPLKNAMNGGAEQEKRRALWRSTIVHTAEDPLVKLIAAFNQDRRRDRIVAMGEWWCGASPVHDVRFNGTFYGPEKCATYLLERLMRGGETRFPEPLPRWAPEKPVALEVLYDDRDIIVINKPSRLTSVPGIREKISAFTELQKSLGELHVVHRLDADTSGILVFAKNKAALAALNESFRERRVHKRYRALLDGTVTDDRGQITLPLGLNVFDRPRQCVLPEAAGGSPSVTDFEVVARFTAADGTPKTLIDLYPATGRTHQLRVHCAHRLGLGCPISGDPLYSKMGLAAEDERYRLCLHAAEITFAHPMTGETVHIEKRADFDPT